MVGRFESGKDIMQVLTESAATHIGNIASIVTGAVRDIASETGDWLTDVIEMREASQLARQDGKGSPPDTDTDPSGPEREPTLDNE